MKYIAEYRLITTTKAVIIIVRSWSNKMDLVLQTDAINVEDAEFICKAINEKQEILSLFKMN